MQLTTRRGLTAVPTARHFVDSFRQKPLAQTNSSPKNSKRRTDMMDFSLYANPFSASLTPMSARAGLTDAQWDLIKDLFDCRRKRKHDLRGIVDGIIYVLQSDDNWRMLPLTFAPWQTVYYYYDKWRKSGLWFQVVQRLPEELRLRLIEDARPSLSLVDYAPGILSGLASPRPQAPSYTRRFTWPAETAGVAESRAA